MRRLIGKTDKANKARETTRAEAHRARKSRPPKKQLGLRGWLLPGVVSGGLALAWQQGYPQQVVDRLHLAGVNLTGSAGLTLRRVTVEGRLRTPRADVFAALGATQGDPILGIDIDQARARLESIDWVRSASPVAIWQNRGRFSLVDTDGHVINRQDVGGWSHLPIVVGDGAPERTRDLLAMLATENRMAERVRAAVLVSGRRWNLHIGDPSSDVEIRLPETDPDKAWAWFASLQRDHNILARDVRIVDLRTPDRLVVRLASDVVEETQVLKGGEDT